MHHQVVISVVLPSGILTPVGCDYPATHLFLWKKNLNYNVVPEIIPRYASSVGIRYNFTNAESPSAPSSSRAGEHNSFPNFQVESIEKPSGLALAYFNRFFFLVISYVIRLTNLVSLLLPFFCVFQIVHNLSRATNLDARLTRLEERSRHVQLTDESICDSCRARLGTKLFVMYPDDSVVCYRVCRSYCLRCMNLLIVTHLH